jgi:hypothetical protein
MRRRHVTQPATLAATLVLAVAAAMTTGQGVASPTATSWLLMPARTLAALDCRCAPGRPRIARYRRALDALAARCAESPGRVAYISKTATELLRRSGRRRSNLWLLNEVRGTLDPGTQGEQPCRFVFALVVESIL